MYHKRVLEGGTMKLFNSLMKFGLLMALVVGMGDWSVALAGEGEVLSVDTGDTA